MKSELLILVTGLLAGSQVLGLLPLWVGIFGFLALAIVIGTEGVEMFRGAPAEESNNFEKVTSTWLNTLYQNEKLRQPTRASWNCKNCGGPNLNQVQCQYCGAIKG
jgi:hypothetical protein